MNESAMNNHKELIWGHRVTEPEVPFFYERKGIVKI